MNIEILKNKTINDTIKYLPFAFLLVNEKYSYRLSPSTISYHRSDNENDIALCLPLNDLIFAILDPLCILFGCVPFF